VAPGLIVAAPRSGAGKTTLTRPMRGRASGSFFQLIAPM
jgi:cobyrinic acid a,c-diamide synthase